MTPRHQLVRTLTTNLHRPNSAITILVADDDPGLREVTGAMLLELGYRVLVASDGETALRHATGVDGGKIDVLLTDYRMPGMRGNELAERFHSVRPAAAIIMMSAESPELPAVPQCEFLAKPFRIAVLREKIHAVLSTEVAA